jgi:hypothetical protein
MALRVSLQHFQNPKEAINQEIFVCLHNRIWQRLNLFLKSRDNVVDGVALLRICRHRAPLPPHEAHEAFYDGRCGSPKTFFAPPQQQPHDRLGHEFFLA